MLDFKHFNLNNTDSCGCLNLCNVTSNEPAGLTVLKGLNSIRSMDTEIDISMFNIDKWSNKTFE